MHVSVYRYRTSTLQVRSSIFSPGVSGTCGESSMFQGHPTDCLSRLIARKREASSANIISRMGSGMLYVGFNVCNGK